MSLATRGYRSPAATAPKSCVSLEQTLADADRILITLEKLLVQGAVKYAELRFLCWLQDLDN